MVKLVLFRRKLILIECQKLNQQIMVLNFEIKCFGVCELEFISVQNYTMQFNMV